MLLKRLCCRATDSDDSQSGKLTGEEFPIDSRLGDSERTDAGEQGLELARRDGILEEYIYLSTKILLENNSLEIVLD